MTTPGDLVTLTTRMPGAPTWSGHVLTPPDPDGYTTVLWSDGATSAVRDTFLTPTRQDTMPQPEPPTTDREDAHAALTACGVTPITDQLIDGVLALAEAGRLTHLDAGRVAQAAEIAATAMTQFNLKGSDVPHVVDLLAALGQPAETEHG